MGTGRRALQCAEGADLAIFLHEASFSDPTQILKDATLFFSRNVPSLSMVIPSMDYIDEHFATSAVNISLKPSIRRSLLIAKKTLNRYYNMTDWSETYRIAMGESFFILLLLRLLTNTANSFTVLHPRHKLAYFKTAKWRQSWIDTAEAIVRAEYQRSYADDAAVSTSDESEPNHEDLMSSQTPKVRNIDSHYLFIL